MRDQNKHELNPESFHLVLLYYMKNSLQFLFLVRFYKSKYRRVLTILFEFEKKNLKLIFYVQFVWFYPINLNESMVFS